MEGKQKSDRRIVGNNAMSVNQRVHPNCVNASNPYHECGVACLEKIAQGKGRNDQKKKAGSILSFGRKDRGSESQPMSPRNAFFDSEPIKTRRSESQPMTPRNAFFDPQPTNPPVLDNPPLKNSAKPPVATSPRSHFSGRGHNGESYSSTEQEIYTRDHSLEKEKIQSPLSYSTSGTITPDHTEDALTRGNTLAKTDVKETTLHNSDRSLNFSVSDISRLSDESDEEDVQPEISNVLVGKYHVKASVASILQSIFNKHGDIAANCNLESTAMRGYYLECICSIVEELRLASSYSRISKSKVKKMLIILKDLEFANIDVGWLHSVLDYITDGKKLISEHQAIEAAKAKCDYVVESTRKELESLTENVAQKEKELDDARALVAETEARLSQVELESAKLNERMLGIQTKIDEFNGKSLEDQLI